MKKEKFSKAIALVLVICGLLLFAILYVPMWRIDLDAPQYPEGLRLLIYADRLGGNVDIINGLNHYIGMKTLHVEDFVEFKILPYIISAFGLFFIITGIMRKRKLMYLLFTMFVIFGIVAMADFWKWEYDYGHNLNPEAAIIVPGMAYQPPLIGFKQLLNFGAYSIPDIGGWLFIVAGASLLAAIIFDRYQVKKLVRVGSVATMCLLMTTMISCSTDVEKIKLGVDNCAHCQMTISNARFGCELITTKGKIYKYDELSCLLAAQEENKIPKKDIAAIYTIDFSGKHDFTKVENAFYLKSQELRSPMGGNVASFSNQDSLKFYLNQFPGEEVNLFHD